MVSRSPSGLVEYSNFWMQDQVEPREFCSRRVYFRGRNDTHRRTPSLRYWFQPEADGRKGLKGPYESSCSLAEPEDTEMSSVLEATDSRTAQGCKLQADQIRNGP